MGGALAAEASAAGHEVHVVDVSTALVDHIREQGLSVTGPQPVTAHPHATTDPSEVGVVDVVVLFVKAQHTRAAAATIEALRGPDTVVVSLQNGWGNADVLAEVLGTRNLVFGVTYNSCSIAGLGVVLHSGHGETFVGVVDPDADEAPARVAAELLTSSGWPATATDGVRTEIWKKLILNAATLPTAALTGLPAGALGRCEPMLALVDDLAREAVDVARALGLPIDAEERIERIHGVLAAAGDGKASMLQDVEARRKTEVEVINQAVVDAGARLGVATPLNTTMTELIAGLEESWTR